MMKGEHRAWGVLGAEKYSSAEKWRDAFFMLKLILKGETEPLSGFVQT